MASLPFPAREGLTWTHEGKVHTATVDGVTLTAERAWFSGRWTLRATSPLALPLDVTLYISLGGGGHAYWSNASVSIRNYWHETYFVYCSLPALVPLLVGDATRDAIAAHDDPHAEEYAAIENHPKVALHVRARTIETTTVVNANEDRVIDEHLAIHRALAADHEALIGGWQETAEEIGAELVSTWPPVISVPSPFGSVTIVFQWSTSERRGAQAAIELSVDARHAPLWSIERQASAIPNGTTIGGGTFLVSGDIPIDREALGRVVRHADIESIVVRRNVVVRIARSRPDAGLFRELIEMLGLICGSSSPYR